MTDTVFQPKVGQILENKATGELVKVIHAETMFIDLDYGKVFTMEGDTGFISNGQQLKKPIARVLRYYKPSKFCKP